MNSRKDIVGKAFNELLIDDKFDYVLKGVPARVLELKVTHELRLRSKDKDFTNVHSKAKELIKTEVKKQTLVKLADGNYSAGPKSGCQRADDNSNDADLDEGVDEYEDDDDDDDEEEEEDDDADVKFSGGGDDSDYSPSYGASIRRSPQRRGEGRVSARQKKSRFDCEDYVFPNRLKNFMKRTSPGSSPVKPKAPKKKPGPKPKNRVDSSTCGICRNSGGLEDGAVDCKNCLVKAHRPCAIKEMKGKPLSDWMCLHCSGRLKHTKWKCTECGSLAGKEMGVLVSCESCSAKYHKQCHRPPIPESNKLLNTWKCFSCMPQESSTPSFSKRPETPAPVTRRPSSVASADSTEVEEVSSQKSDSEPAHKRFLDGSACFKCKSSFPNANDRATCSNCKLSFHARCCRAREIANLTRLGSRKAKWRCDACKFVKGGKQTRKKKSVEEAGEETVFNADDSVDMVEEIPMEVEDDKKDVKHAWWRSRLRPITVGPNQPPLGPIPDPGVPEIARWTALDVQEYFDEFFQDKGIGMVFAEHDIDGKALKLMRRNDIITVFQDAGFGFNIVLGVIMHIKRLQLRVNDRRYIWADTM